MVTWLDDLHRNLRLGEAGRPYTELAAVGAGAGWRRVVAAASAWRRRVRRMLGPDLAAGVGVRRTRSWHASTGMWIAVVLLILPATGLTWSTYAGARFDLVQVYARYRATRRAAGKDRRRRGIGSASASGSRLPDAAGITRRIRLHDLRHAHASWVLAGERMCRSSGNGSGTPA